MSVVGDDELRRMTEVALAACGGDDAEVVVTARTEGLTRYASAAIHQNVETREFEIRVRVVNGRRVALARTDRADRDGIEAAARSATELAQAVPENPEFGGLTEAQPIPDGPAAFAASTADATPLDRARAAKLICDAARENDLGAAGFVATTLQEIAIASTRGVWAYAPETVSQCEAVGIGDAGSSYAKRTAVDLEALDVRGVADEAIGKTLLAQRPRDLAPGEHEVVLEAYAVNDIATFLGQSLTGSAVEEGRSFVADRIGEHVTGDVTIVDDPADALSLPRAFDFEGHPAERVVLIERGVARAVVYDSQTAHRMKQRNTGHAMPPNPFSPSSPMHLRIEPGDRTREQLIGDTKEGVLVTRFWYTRWVHPLRTIVTGTTRDGTFAIRDGEIAYAVKNFRFTQSYAGALEAVLGIGSELHLGVSGFRGISGAARVPALRLARFAFTGATSY